MVRIKHRYLLINILYPDTKDAPANATRLKDDQEETVPYTVQFHQPSSDRLDARLLMKIIRDGVSDLFGDYGSGMIAGSLQVKYFSPATSTAIVRVSRDHYRLVWAALTFTMRLPKPVDQACVVQVVRVSGTIRKAEEEAIRRARMGIRRAQRQVTGPKLRGSSTEVTTGNKDLDAMDGKGKVEDDDLGFADGIEDAEEAGERDEESE